MLFTEFLESIAITIEGNDSYSKATLNMEFRITIRIALVVFIMKYSLRVNITYSSLSSHGHTNEYIDLSS